MELDLAIYKEILLKMREEALATDDKVTDTLVMESYADELDVASQDSQAVVQKRLLERQASYLKRIDAALEKISDGTYGECEQCGDKIAPKRLLARPVALLCILCKEKQERLEKADKAPRGFMSDDAET